LREQPRGRANLEKEGRGIRYECQESLRKKGGQESHRREASEESGQEDNQEKWDIGERAAEEEMTKGHL
jgi:hypothetical protein